MTEETVIENAWQRAKARALKSEGCSSPSCRESNIEMLDLMHDELCELPARVAAKMQTADGTTLEFGRFKLRGKSAVMLAVKYGMCALVALVVLYLVARVHGWIPAIPHASGPSVAVTVSDEAKG